MIIPIKELNTKYFKNLFERLVLWEKEKFSTLDIFCLFRFFEKLTYVSTPAQLLIYKFCFVLIFFSYRYTYF